MAQPVLNGHFAKLSHGLVVPQKDAMRYEALRVASFQTFPKSVPQSALKLANAGFYYIGKDDEVECFDCVLKLKDWGPNDDPFEVHRRYSIDCPYINNNGPDNVPLASRGASNDSVQATASQFGRLSTSNRTLETAKPQVTTGNNLSAQREGQNFSGQELSHPAATPENRPKQSGQSTFQQAHHNLSGTNHNQAISNSSSLFARSEESVPYIESKNDYRYERSRLATYQNWPSNAAVRPEELAKNGFYYTGSDDRVQCTFCRGILRNWEPSDQADAEHRRHFGQCPFLNNPYSVGNVAIGDEYKMQNNKNDPDFQDYCQSIVTDRPVHQRYSLPADRLGTFKEFPTNMTQTPEQFARAGFYYSGIADQVKCFFCDGGLRNWEPNDDPWTEHARWFPRCGYLRLCKGDEFIKEVQGRYAPPSQNKRPPRLRNANNLPKHKVDTKKVLEHLKSRIVTAVLDMGYDKEKVKIVIRRRMEDLGEDFFPNAESLLDAVTEYEDELKYTEVYGGNEEEEQTEEQNETAETANNANGTVATEPKKKNKKKNKKNKKKNTSDTNNMLGISEPLTHLDEDEAKVLAEDVQRLRDERTCKICMDEEVNVVFLKCGHLVCCSNCAPALRHCPICRETIRGTVRVFLS